MKKITLLTPLLVLTACGGGTGGGYNAPNAIVNPSDSLTAEQRAAAIDSNKKVTGMNSFVVVGGKNPTINTNSRAASSGVILSDGGIRYDLSNVHLHTTTFTEDYINPDEGADIILGIKEGKIESLSFIGPEHFGEDGVVGKRNDEIENFSGIATVTFKEEVFEDTGNGEKHQVFDEYGNPVYKITTSDVEFGLTYNSFGDDFANNALQYADFGEILIKNTEEESNEYFAGGYSAKKINLDEGNVKIEKDITFSGIADASVHGSTGYDENLPEQHTEKTKSLRDEHAKLVLMTDGKSTLNANFANWYDVSVDFTKEGKVSGIDFYNLKPDSDKDLVFSTWDKDESGSFTDINYHETHVGKEQQYIANSDTLEDTNVIRNGFIEYYGDGTNPAEAVGVIKYAESGGSAYMDHFVDSEGNERDIFKHKGIIFNMGFGLKRD